MEKLLQLFGLAPTDEEKEFLNHLGENAPRSMQVLGRGTLVMSASDARKTRAAKNFIQNEGPLIAKE